MATTGSPAESLQNKPKGEEEGGSWKRARAALDRLAEPWSDSTLWLSLQVLIVWTITSWVLLQADLQKGSDTDANNWIRGVLVVAWLLFIARYLMLLVMRDRPSPNPEFVIDYTLWQQADAMTRFAAQRGKTPDARDLATVRKYDSVSFDKPSTKRMNEIAEAHQHLSRLVAPAVPMTILLLWENTYQVKPEDEDVDAESRHRHTPRRLVQSFSWLGNVRLARMMLGLALALLPVFIALALYKGSSLAKPEDLVTGGFVSKAASAAYLIVASALGAAFAALFKVRKYVEHLNYDPQYESSYWVRFVLGLVAGLLLSVLLVTLLPDQKEADAFRITLPILALVGGFSSDLVYRILKRLIDSIETLIEGSASEINEAEKTRSDARLRELEMESRQHLNESLLAGKRVEAKSLIETRKLLPHGTGGDEARKQIDARLAALFEEAEVDDDDDDDSGRDGKDPMLEADQQEDNAPLDDARRQERGDDAVVDDVPPTRS
ncbi:hypothetical protein [Marmoricola sp. URHB0036]|uniref:hypothetical protein n=1 Tax=Marmoricola sp. URHB0036 TaxID=1298863 RepID=UPI0012DCBF9E|nr:hypothetical protein [Marmoricola sp. URHB0036]